eukprot:CAMPEP_0116871272 /NCGR_PEP_ID=MMETSP0463-20121206/1525_1 /TAXON_ID=181622 /ORGANISM="Strombidinopsis sp, Strain SopsisLIS2011" /LENGTH=65 /DNA_ID=CAMNT_0004509333 /DNA_START=1699 /DNA_END=1896 /DNA_ORIENTATION=+
MTDSDMNSNSSKSKSSSSESSTGSSSSSDSEGTTAGLNGDYLKETSDVIVSEHDVLYNKLKSEIS